MSGPIKVLSGYKNSKQNIEYSNSNNSHQLFDENDDDYFFGDSNTLNIMESDQKSIDNNNNNNNRKIKKSINDNLKNNYEGSFIEKSVYSSKASSIVKGKPKSSIKNDKGSIGSRSRSHSESLKGENSRISSSLLNIASLDKIAEYQTKAMESIIKVVDESIFDLINEKNQQNDETGENSNNNSNRNSIQSSLKFPNYKKDYIENNLESDVLQGGVILFSKKQTRETSLDHKISRKGTNPKRNVYDVEYPIDGGGVYLNTVEKHSRQSSMSALIKQNISSKNSNFFRLDSQRIFNKIHEYLKEDYVENQEKILEKLKKNLSDKDRNL